MKKWLNDQHLISKLDIYPKESLLAG